MAPWSGKIQIAEGGVQDSETFKAPPQDFNVQPGLRITGLKRYTVLGSIAG